MVLLVARTGRSAVRVATGEGEIVGEHEQQHEPEERRTACYEWLCVLEGGELAVGIEQMHLQRQRCGVAETVGDDKVIDALLGYNQRGPILEFVISLPRSQRQHIERCETRSEL